MQAVILSGLFGVVGAMILWAVASTSTMQDMMARRGESLAPPEEL